MKYESKINVLDSLIPKVSAVDLFCGAGGLTYGLEKAGIDVRLRVSISILPALILIQPTTKRNFYSNP